MTNRTSPQAVCSEAPSLRERAGRLRDAAGRFIKRAAALAEGDQPQQASIPEGKAASPAAGTFSAAPTSPDHADRGHPEAPERDRAEGGREPRREHDMGRHESFDPSNATPTRVEHLSASSPDILGGRNATAQALERMAPHWPGFVPYPTHEPKTLTCIEVVLRLESERLLSLAHDEFARLYALQSEGLDEPGREMVAARLRRFLRIDALTMAADPEGDAHEGGTHADLTMMTGGVVDDDGRVTFCDASGRVLRKPVAAWIRFTAKRLHHQAQREMARRLNDQDLAESERQALARELRRSLSTDAINILAFRPGTACDVAEAAEADAFSGPIPVPPLAGAGTVSPDLLRAIEAHREARQLMLNDPDESDERTERAVIRVDVLAQAIRDVPARSVADLRCKMVYLWPSNLEGEEVSPGLAATFTSFNKDVARLATPVPEATAGPDPILAAIEASRAAQSAVEAWTASIEARATPPAEADFADEDRLVEAQSEARSRVIDTVPTTPAGRLALLEYLRWQMGLYGYTDGAPPDRDSYFWRFAYKALKAALAWDGPATIGGQDAGADAELIALGRAFDVATVREIEAVKGEDEQAEAIASETEAFARRIAAKSARTVEGMRAKLRVAAFYGACDPDTPENEGYPGEAAIRSLYRDTPGIEISTNPSDVRIVPEAPAVGEPTPSLADQIIACWREWSAQLDDDFSEAGEARYEHLASRRYSLLDAAEELPATLENVLPKALASAWLEYVALWSNGRPREAYSTDGRLAIDIDTAITGRLKTIYLKGAA